MSIDSNTCPKCGCGDIASVPAVYEQGTSTSNYSGSSSTGTVHSVDGLLAYSNSQNVHSGQSSSQTLLAQRLAPPSEPNFKGCMLLMTLVVVFLQLMIAGVIGIFSKETAKAFSDNSTTIFLVFAVGTGLGYYGLCYAAYLKLMEIWRSRVVCLRCGSVWET